MNDIPMYKLHIVLRYSILPHQIKNDKHVIHFDGADRVENQFFGTVEGLIKIKSNSINTFGSRGQNKIWMFSSNSIKPYLQIEHFRLWRVAKIKPKHIDCNHNG